MAEHSQRVFPPIWTAFRQVRLQRRASEADGSSVITRAQNARREFLERFTLGPASRKRRNSESSPNDSVKRARLDTNDLLPIKERPPQTGLGGRLTEITLSATRHCTSLIKYLETLNVKLRKRFEAQIAERRGLKVFYAIRLFYVKVHGGANRFEAFLHTTMRRVTSVAGIPHVLQCFEDEILNRNANYMRNESGLIIDEISDCRLNMATYAPLISGSSYAKLPTFLINKKAIVNVNNKDNRCFGYAIISCLQSDNAFAKDRGRSSQYDKYFSMYGLDEIDYPVEISDIPDLEKKLEKKLEKTLKKQQKSTFRLTCSHFTTTKDVHVTRCTFRSDGEKTRSKSTCCTGKNTMRGLARFSGSCTTSRNQIGNCISANAACVTTRLKTFSRDTKECAPA